MEERVIVTLHSVCGDVRYEGTDLFDVLKDLWWGFYDLPYAKNGMIAGNDCTFTIDGVNSRFLFHSCAFHHCFDNGHITLKEMLDIVVC